MPRIEGSLALSEKRGTESESTGTMVIGAAAPAEVVRLRPKLNSPIPSSPTGSHVLRKGRKPPVLASEALRKELLPPTPACNSGRLLVVLVGCAGLCAAALAGDARQLGLPLGGAFLTLAALSVVPMTYQARAAATVALGASGLMVVHWLQHTPGPATGSSGLLLGVTVLATGLLFRGWHRASGLARLLVAIGIVGCSAWLWRTAALERLLVLEGAFQTWLPPLLVIPLPVLLLLSLLAFMDARSTGGSGTWAALLLGWHMLFNWAALLRLAWPPDQGALDFARVPAPLVLALLAAPLFQVAVALGLAQLLSYARAAQRPT